MHSNNEQEKNTCALTIVPRVNPLSQQEAAELVFSMLCVLDLHKVRRHTERIVLQVTFTLLTTTGSDWGKKKVQMKPQHSIPLFHLLNTWGQYGAAFEPIHV